MGCVDIIDGDDCISDTIIDAIITIKSKKLITIYDFIYIVLYKKLTSFIELINIHMSNH